MKLPLIISFIVNLASRIVALGTETKEIVILGSGPSGCTAAIYSGRALLKPLVVAGYAAGGQLMLTSDVENFPGYEEAIPGPKLMSDLEEQAKKFDAEFWKVDCLSVNLSVYPFEIRTYNTTLRTKSLVISTGARSLWLEAENEEEYKGKGISTCATCDGYMFRNKSVIVIGGGDSATEEALFLTRFANDVTLIHRRDTFRASKVMLDRVQRNPKIKVLTSMKVSKWHGQECILSGVSLINTTDDTQLHLECSGAFIAIGHVPNTAFLQNQIELDSVGYVILKNHSMTSVPGVFACGDVTDTRYKQAITAAGSGCQVAMDAEKWLEEQSTTAELTAHTNIPTMSQETSINTPVIDTSKDELLNELRNSNQTTIDVDIKKPFVINHFRRFTNFLFPRIKR